MGGLENRGEVGNFIGIYNGKLCQRVKENEAGSVARVLEKGKNAGKTIFEKYYDRLTGKLVDIKTKEAPFGKMWEFSFKNNEDVYILSLGYSNGYAKTLLKCLPNINLSEPFTISPSQKEEEGKTKSTLFVNQNGEAIKWAYTREVPNGMPPMTQIKVKGVDTWDDTDILIFLENMVKTQILPNLDKSEVVAEAENSNIDPDLEF